MLWGRKKSEPCLKLFVMEFERFMEKLGYKLCNSACRHFILSLYTTITECGSYLIASLHPFLNSTLPARFNYTTYRRDRTISPQLTPSTNI